MDRINIRTHIPQLLRDWNINEVQVSNVIMEPGGIKSGRRALIRKAELTAETGEKRHVVVKLVNPQYASRSEDPERRLRLLEEYFKRESRIWTALGAHSNIVPLLGFIPTAQTQAFPSLVMPYYRSGDLRHLVNETRVSLKVKIQLMRGVANGLLYMHSREPPAIHRDLKASNILVEEMISGQGERFRARIADFGSAKLFEIENDVQVTGGTSASISMPWTPPEYVTYSDTTGDAVIDYSHPTCAGDIWSFGCTFLEILQKADPWRDLAPGDELLQGKCPPKPESCIIDEDCWALMILCWARQTRRITAEGLYWKLDALEKRK